ncbi:FAD-binding oxidoreductase [Paraburkholderia sp. LEh10]|uniref:FAD-binding oxidoreductase n=1 Tax=Paraburkholderia sp. LEh10 TaxID=2821353 RepID=UPI001AE48E32|nr:FAD-binding oxidoreductase [Paraburkholderia sp. LEh10]
MHRKLRDHVPRRPPHRDAPFRTVDASVRTVRAESGCNWGEVNDALQQYGLAARGDFVSITGAAGLTLGGRLGWLVRKHGLALDNLQSAEIVLADGHRVTASSHENEDLFRAIRGGGGNFGVVTSFEFKVHPTGTVLAGIVLRPASNAAGAIAQKPRVMTSSYDPVVQLAAQLRLRPL